MTYSIKTSSIIAIAVLMGASTAGAWAQSFPDRPISVIVPYGAGGQTDIAARVLSDALTQELGTQVSVVNKSGGGGVVGTAELATSKPDGYTIGLATSTPLIQKPNISKTPYSVDSFDYICRVNNNPLIFVVKKGSKIKTVDDLIAAAKAGDRITYGSSGEASVQHVAMTRLSTEAGVELVHVPNTSDAKNLRNILAGVLTGTLVPASVLVANSDTIQPVGLMDTEHLQSFPDLPTFEEEGYDVTAAVWGVLSAPKGLSEGVLSTLRSACKEAQTTKAFKKQIKKMGMEPAYLDGDAAREMVLKQNKSSRETLKKLGYAK